MPKKSVAPSVIRNIIGVLKLVLGGKVWRNWKLSLPETPLKEQRYLTPTEICQIINAATGQWKAIARHDGDRAEDLTRKHNRNGRANLIKRLRAKDAGQPVSSLHRIPRTKASGRNPRKHPASRLRRNRCGSSKVRT